MRSLSEKNGFAQQIIRKYQYGRADVFTGSSLIYRKDGEEQKAGQQIYYKNLMVKLNFLFETFSAAGMKSPVNRQLLLTAISHGAPAMKENFRQEKAGQQEKPEMNFTTRIFHHIDQWKTEEKDQLMRLVKETYGNETVRQMETLVFRSEPIAEISKSETHLQEIVKSLEGVYPHQMQLIMQNAAGNPAVRNQITQEQLIGNRMMQNPMIENRKPEASGQAPFRPLAEIHSQAVIRSQAEIPQSEILQPPIVHVTQNQPGQSQSRQNQMTQNQTEQNSLIQNRTAQNYLIQNQSIQNKILQNQSIQNKILRNQSIQNKIIQNQSIQNQSIQNQSIPNRILRNQMIQDQSGQNRVIQSQVIQNQSGQNRIIQSQVIQNQSAQDQVAENRGISNSTLVNRKPEASDQAPSRPQPEIPQAPIVHMIQNQRDQKQSTKTQMPPNRTAQNNLTQNQSIPNRMIRNQSGENRVIRNSILVNRKPETSAHTSFRPQPETSATTLFRPQPEILPQSVIKPQPEIRRQSDILPPSIIQMVQSRMILNQSTQNRMIPNRTAKTGISQTSIVHTAQVQPLRNQRIPNPYNALKDSLPVVYSKLQNPVLNHRQKESEEQKLSPIAKEVKSLEKRISLQENIVTQMNQQKSPAAERIKAQQTANEVTRQVMKNLEKEMRLERMKRGSL